MKTRYKLLLMAAFLTIGIFISFQVRYNQKLFIMKHISFFTFYSLLTFFIIQYFYKLLNPRIEKVPIKNIGLYFKGFSVFVFGLALFGISNTQLTYIKDNETPVLLECYYYDHYGNNIYNSFFPFSCPDFEIISESTDFIHMRLNETLTANEGILYASEKLKGETEAEILVDIYINYESQKMKTYVIDWTETAKVKNGDSIRYGYISVRKEVTDTYSSSSIFQSDQKNYQFVNTFDELNDTLYSHYDFTDKPYKSDSLVVYEDFNTDDDKYYINVDITKTDLEGTTKTEKVAIGELLHVNSNFKSLRFHSEDYFPFEEYLYVTLREKSVTIEKNTTEQILEYIGIDYTAIKELLVQDVVHSGHGSNIEETNYISYPTHKKDVYHLEEIKLSYLWKIVPIDIGYKVERYTNIYGSRGTRDYNDGIFISPNQKYYQLEYFDYEWDLFMLNTNRRIIWEPNPLLTLQDLKEN